MEKSYNLYNPLFKCKKCQSYLTEPRLCNKCNEFYCYSCFQNLSNCIQCHANPIQEKENRTLTIIMSTTEYICNICKNSFPHKEIKAHLEQCEKELLTCNFCYLKGTEEQIWAHLIKKHKKDIIKTHSYSSMDSHRTYTNAQTLRGFGIDSINQQQQELFQPQMQNARNTFSNHNQRPNIIYANNRINTNTNTNANANANAKAQINSNSNININISNINNDDISKKVNEELEKYGHCKTYDNNNGKGKILCKNCMTKVKLALNLKNGELINKAGKICRFENYFYHCGEKYTSQEKSINNKIITHNNICDAIHSSCDNCKPFNEKAMFEMYLSKEEIEIRRKTMHKN